MDTLFTGKVVHHVDSIDSTNELAIKYLKDSSVIEGTAFRADNQTGGKGQRGRVWKSAPGQNLLVSFVFFPDFLKVDAQFYLVKAVSLAVKDLLDKYLIDRAKIKWPNDIYINDLKIAGILIESTMKGDFMSNSVIGIGLNVNQKEFFDAVKNPTSVVLETGMGCDLDMLFRELSFHIEKRYLMLKQDKRSLDQAYFNALYLGLETAAFLINDNKELCTIMGVNQLGQLILKKEDGTTQSYGMHQATLLI